jgi:23S rRNA pseudouridine2605 synthase
MIIRRPYAVARGRPGDHPAHVTMSGKKTLDRILSRLGACSRRQAHAAIAAGRVQCNGRVVHDPETWVDLVRDRVLLDGEPLRARAKEVWALHKPTGYVTTAADEHGRDTVYALLPDDAAWLAPIGRLDKDSSGLLLFTNDSDLAQAINDPVSKLPKVYVVRCKGDVGDDAIVRLREGIELHDGRTSPAKVERLDADDRSTRLRIVLTEGRNRQIRRMVMAIGSRVHTLRRERVGPIELGDQPEGACRRLDAGEVQALRAAVKTARARGRPSADRVR